MKKRKKSPFLLATAALLGGSASPALAQGGAVPVDARAATRHYAIPAGTLGDALTAFSRLTGVVIVDQEALSVGARSAGVSGTFTVEEALAILLDRTGLAFRFTSPRAVRLTRQTAGAQELGAVVVTGRKATLSSPKYTEPLRDVPQTVNVVTAEVLSQQGVTSLRDALRNVSGLTVNAGEGGATPGDNFNVRGFSARGDVFVDGVRDLGGFSRETFNIEQVEVTKGPGSTYTGRGSTGGAINLVTKSPHARPLYQGTLGAGSADFGRATADVNQPLGGDVLHGAMRLNAVWQDAGVAGLDLVRNRSWGVAPSVAFGLGTPTRVTAGYFHNEQDNLPSYGITSLDSVPKVDTRNFFGLTALDREHVRASQASLRAEHDVNESLTLRSQVGWSGQDVNRIVTFANASTAARASRSHLTHNDNLSGQASLTSRFRTRNIGHALVAGVDVARERSQFAGYTLSAPPPKVEDLANPDPSDAYTGTVSARRPTRDATSSSAGIYAFETMGLGERFDLTAGLRYDYFRAAYQDSLGVPLNPAGTTTRALTWRAGAVFKPTGNGSIYAAYGTSFNPSGELLALDSRGTAGLDPERSRSFELGTKWDLADARLSLTAAAFRTEKTNARMTNPDDPSGLQILGGDQRVEGAELGVTGLISRVWSMVLGYTWMQSKVVAGAPADVGNPLPNTPRNSASLWSTYTLPSRVELGAGVRYTGARFLRRTLSVPEYTTVDASVAYPVARRLTMRLNLTNLTNETYYDSGRFWVPAPARSFRLTADVHY